MLAESLLNDRYPERTITMKKKQRKPGRPTKPLHEKAVLLIVTIKPHHKRKIDAVMQSRGIDRSKAVQWIIEESTSEKDKA